MEVEAINEHCCASLLDNIYLNKSENLLETTPQTDILHKTLKIISKLIY